MTMFLRYLTVGAFNTLFGYGVIFGCMYIGNMTPITSNILGYAVGFLISYAFNRSYTFRSKQEPADEILRFSGIFLFSFAVNFFTLIALVDWWHLHAALGQIFAGTIFMLTSFFLNKYFVFGAGRRDIKNDANERVATGGNIKLATKKLSRDIPVDD